MEFLFTNDIAQSRIDEVIEHSLGPRLWISDIDYPDQLAWAERASREIKQGIKRNMVALTKGEVVGSIIYQRHKTNPDTLEIKRLTVRPDVRGRHIASFLLRNTEIEGMREFEVSRVELDAKARNTELGKFFLSNHYQVVKQVDLYGLDAGEDIVYQKDLSQLQ